MRRGNGTIDGARGAAAGSAGRPLGRGIVGATGAWAALTLLALGALATPARAQEEPQRQAAKDGADAQPEAGAPLAWDGRTIQASGVVLAEAPDVQGAKAAQLRSSLGEALVTLRVERAFDQVGGSLQRIWLQAASARPFDGQAELLVQIALARSELAQALEKPVQALLVLGRLLPQTGDPRWKDQAATLVPAPPALVALAEEAARDPRLAARRDELTGKIGGERPDSQGLEALAETAVKGGNIDADLLRQIGAAAAPALAKLILATADTFPKAEADPLLLLIELDTRYAAHTLLEHFAAGGPVWWKRITAAMADRGVIDDPELWVQTPEDSTVSRYRVPEWLDLLALLARKTPLGPELSHMLRLAAESDALTPSLQEALVARLAEASSAEQVAETLGFDGVVPSERPVLEAAMATSFPDVRLFAAKKLSEYRDADPLLGLAQDPDPRLRAISARSLGQRYALSEYVNQRRDMGGTVKRSFQWGSSAIRTMFAPALGPGELKVLSQLLADPEAAVRAAATSVLTRKDVTVDANVYERLARDTSDDVREHLVWTAQAMPPDIRRSVLAGLAVDASSTVQKAVDELLQGLDSTADPSSWLPALRIRLEALPSDQWSQELGIDNLLGNLLHTTEGLRSFVSWSLDRKSDDLLLQVLSSIEVGPTVKLHRRLDLLDDRQLAALSVRVYHAAPEWSDLLRTYVEGAAAQRAGAMRLVLADEDADRDLRIQAAKLAAPTGGKELGQAFLSFLRVLGQEAEPLSERELGGLTDAWEALPSEQRNLLLLEVLEDPVVPDALAAVAVGTYAPEAAHGREITLGVLGRWFADGAPDRSVVREALEHLRSLPQDADSELLVRALAHAAYTRTVIETMGALRRPEFVAPLGRALQADWMLDEDQRKWARVAAVKALGSYLDESVVPLLLQALGSGDPEVRQAATQALDQLRDYRERTAAWSKLGQEAPTRESAVARLAKMLSDDSPEVRAQAARGLATLKAVELLPRLIELLHDDDANVRTAAQEALDRLNGGKGEKAD